MNRKNFVCYEHRIARRYGDFAGGHAGSLHCPVDGALLTSVGYKTPIPKKRDGKGWAALRESFPPGVENSRAYHD